MKKRKLIYLITFLVLLSGVIGYNYMYKEHRNISKEKAAFNLLSKELITN